MAISKSLKKYIIDVIERVVCTFAETMLGVIGTTSLIGDVNWGVALSASALASFVALLKCFVAKGKGNANSPSLVQ